jgi:hypothetical protein
MSEDEEKLPSKIGGKPRANWAPYISKIIALSQNHPPCGSTAKKAMLKQLGLASDPNFDHNKLGRKLHQMNAKGMFPATSKLPTKINGKYLHLYYNYRAYCIQICQRRES